MHSVMKRSDRVLTRGEIMERIEVREPYFALRNPTVASSGHVSAEVPVEQPLGLEILPINAAEAGRHLAILGSVAAAFANPKTEKHFYLAHKAILQRHTPMLSASSAAQPLVASATGELVSRRTAAARASLGPVGCDPVFSLDIQYHVIAEPVFAKLYKDQRRELRTRERPAAVAPPPFDVHELRANPYRNSLPFYDIEIGNDTLSASLREVTPRHCMGHFPFYPALPVAILASGLFNLSGHLLRHKLQEKGRIAYMVSYLDLTADNLAFAGDHVDLRAEFLDSDGPNHRFHSTAMANGEKCVGDMWITLTEMDV